MAPVNDDQVLLLILHSGCLLQSRSDDICFLEVHCWQHAIQTKWKFNNAHGSQVHHKQFWSESLECKSHCMDSRIIHYPGIGLNERIWIFFAIHEGNSFDRPILHFCNTPLINLYNKWQSFALQYFCQYHYEQLKL